MGDTQSHADLKAITFWNYNLGAHSWASFLELCAYEVVCIVLDTWGGDEEVPWSTTLAPLSHVSCVWSRSALWEGLQIAYWLFLEGITIEWVEIKPYLCY